MRSQSHERLWSPLIKLKFGNGWLTSKCCGSNWKKFNSGFQFQFQFQFQVFQFQFHFQFHQFQFQFQFQFRNWNWNWAAIPIPELNWPQPWLWDSIHCVYNGDRLLKGGKNTYMTSKWNDPTRSLDISTKMTITRRPHSMPKFWA